MKSLRIKVSTHSRPKAAGPSVNQVCFSYPVSTHSRPKAAGLVLLCAYLLWAVSTHSRPKAAGCTQVLDGGLAVVSTHSRPKAAGAFYFSARDVDGGFNTQPPEGGWAEIKKWKHIPQLFQHTAARRRLGSIAKIASRRSRVSTHSRPKAAGQKFFSRVVKQTSFNTQPPEGGWLLYTFLFPFVKSFNTQPPEGGWVPNLKQPP